MVFVVQLEERLFVEQKVVGSKPTRHPKLNSLVAQLVEHISFKDGVTRSYRVGGTNKMESWCSWFVTPD